MSVMTETFKHNLTRLRQHNPRLTERIESIESLSRYEVFNETGKPTDINIFDTPLSIPLYQNPTEEISRIIASFEPKKGYFFHYLFGIGNGFLLHTLLNAFSSARRIVIFEPQPELLYIALHLHDFSEALESKRLLLFDPHQCSESIIKEMLLMDNAIFSSNLFELTCEPYYQHAYDTEYRDFSLRFSRTIRFTLQLLGNDMNDQITGIRQTINRLPTLPLSPSLEELIKEKNSDLAIIISTGPSLIKQLPLLKQAAPYATLISIDASLPILESHGITPDLSVSMERDDPTAAFFQKVSPEFRKNIVFVCAALQHPLVFETLKNDTIVPVLRPLEANQAFGLDAYGYIGEGLSAANMAHDLAYVMGYKRCVLIGQDLSFAPDGCTTHATGHIFASNPSIQKEIEAGRMYDIPAYGGHGNVKTHLFWMAFMDGITLKAHQYAEVMSTLNATEGGARIPGTLEISFADIINPLIAQNIPKQPIRLHNPPLKSAQRLGEKLNRRIEHITIEGGRMVKKLSLLLEELTRINTLLQNRCDEEKQHLLPAKKAMEIVIDLENIREFMKKNTLFETFFIKFISPSLSESEMKILEAVQIVHPNPHIRLIRLIELHYPYIQTIVTLTQTLIELLQHYHPIQEKTK